MSHRLVLQVLVAGLLACAPAPSFAPQGAAPLGAFLPEVPTEAPPFTLARHGGGAQSLEDFRGRVVLLNFWATWCPPCRDELPSLQALWERTRGRGLSVVAVELDSQDRVGAMALIAEFGLDFPMLFDARGTLSEPYQVTELPLTYLIDREGRFIGRVVGSRDWTDPAAVAWIEELLQ